MFKKKLRWENEDVFAYFAGNSKHCLYPRIILDWVTEQQIQGRNLLVLWKIHFYLKNSRLLLMLLFKKFFT